MADQYGLISLADGSWDEVVLTTLPDPIPDGYYSVIVPNDYPVAQEWNPDGRGWMIVPGTAIPGSELDTGATPGMEIAAILDGLIAHGIFTSADKTRIITTGSWT